MCTTKTDKRQVRLCFILSFGTAADTKAAAKLLKDGREWRVVDLTISDDYDGDLNAVYIVRDFQFDGGAVKDDILDVLNGVFLLLPGLTPNRVRYATREEAGLWDGYYDI